jgi:hypothetical protein
MKASYSQKLNSAFISTIYFSKINFDIILSSAPGLFPSGFKENIHIPMHFSILRALCSAHLHFIALSTLYTVLVQIQRVHTGSGPHTPSYKPLEWYLVL